MKTTITILALLLATPAFADERSATLSLGGGLTVGSTQGIDEAAILRVAAAWEPARMALPDHVGTALDVALVPELFVGSSYEHVVNTEDRVELMVGAGVRGELRVARRNPPPRFSVTGATFLALRGAVIGRERDPQLEAVLGQYFFLGRRTSARLGFEFGVCARRNNMSLAEDGPHGTKRSVISQIVLGFNL